MTKLPPFITTKGYRRFADFCDACRKYRYIGLCHGSPGVGKTLSAKQYSRWDLFQPFLGHYETRDQQESLSEIPENYAVVYTPAVVTTPRQLSDQILNLCGRLDSMVRHGSRARSDGQWSLYKFDSRVDLIIVDEADRLQLPALEQLRDISDRSNVGLVLIGMPGIEKRMSRYPQLYSRIGFVHQFKPLSNEEVRFVLEHRWQELGIKLDPVDFTDAEAISAVVRITQGNFRLVQRLFNQIERVVEINEVKTITKEVVEAARESLVIGT